MNRRDLLRASGTTILLGAAGCQAPVADDPSEDETATGDAAPPTPSRNWPLFLYDRTNRRCFSGAIPPDREPSIRWSAETEDAIWASPVVADGVLYVGSYDGRLYAISIDSGEVLWRYRTGERIDGSPAVANGTVFFGSHDRNVYALDAETGEERWIYGTHGIVRSSPTVADGVVYVGSHCRSTECAKYYDVLWPERGAVYALGADRGDRRWRFETGDGVMSTPAVRDATVYVGSSDGTLYALDAATGETRWTFAAAGGIMSSPSVIDGRAFLGDTDGRVYAVDADAGDRVWTFDGNRRIDSRVGLTAVVTGSPVVCDGTVYVGSMVPKDDVSGTLFAIDADDGQFEWTAGPFAHAIGSSPAVVNGIVYFGAHTFDSTPNTAPGLFGVDEDGRERWRYVVDGASHTGFGSSPAIAGGSLYVGSAEGQVLAFELRSNGGVA